MLQSSRYAPVLNILDCFIDGQCDTHCYNRYRNARDETEQQQLALFFRNRRKRQLRSKTSNPSNARKRCRKRTTKKHHLQIRLPDGSLRNITSSDTNWYHMYISNSPRNTRKHQQFRNRFRMPYESFLNFVDDIQRHEMFSRWMSCDAFGMQPCNIYLLTLGFLRYIGRNWTFDDLEEATAISGENHRQFYMVMCKYGSQILYKK